MAKGSLSVAEGDILASGAQVIVNAANTSLQGGGGIDGVIHDAAGQELYDYFSGCAPVKTAEPVLSPSFNLSKRDIQAIIHVAGPIYRDGKHDEEALLRAAYRNSLELVVKEGYSSIAFPIISGGVYGYPYAAAVQIAREECEKFIENHEIDVKILLKR